MKKLITHITSDENYYYLTKEVEVYSIPLFGKLKITIERELLYKDENLDKVKEFETEIHQRFNFAKTTKTTVVE